MRQGNAAGFFRWTFATGAMLIAMGVLLSGCGHALRKTPPGISPAKTEASTGIPACDSYLNNYLACHRAAGIYTANVLQTHYQSMRDTLLQEAGDPRVRPYLANRCLGLSQQLRDALQGRSCTPAHTSNPTTPR